LEELIGQLAVRTVNLDAIKPASSARFGASAKLLDNRWNLFQRERTRHREWDFTLPGIA
jgi:hypothetical protein